jgi:hypothetical protein
VNGIVPLEQQGKENNTRHNLSELTASSCLTISKVGLYVKSTICSHRNGIEPRTYKKNVTVSEGFPQQPALKSETQPTNEGTKKIILRNWFTIVLITYLYIGCCKPFCLQYLLRFNKICSITLWVSSPSPHSGTYILDKEKPHELLLRALS